MAAVDSIVESAHQRTKLITRNMREYTLHDADHLFRVLEHMGRLIPNEVLCTLSVPELALLILSAFLHDVGMAPPEHEIQQWFSFWDRPLPVTRAISEPTKQFGRFVKGHPRLASDIANAERDGQGTSAQLIKEYLVAEHIRTTHAQRAQDIIQSEYRDALIFRNRNLTPLLGRLCKSHNEDAISLQSLESSLIFENDVYACLPFIGVVLRLADLLDFDAKRTPDVLFANLRIEHPVSLEEWKKHRAISGWVIKPRQIAFAADCGHPAIEASIRHFCNVIDTELLACSKVLSTLQDGLRGSLGPKYNLDLPAQVNRDQIRPALSSSGHPLYKFSDTRFTLSQREIIDLLMGKALYGNQPDVAIREALQNSIDTCRERQGLQRHWADAYVPEISVELIQNNGRPILRISDNGMGMNEDIIQRFYAKKGASFYRAQQHFDLQAEAGESFVAISRFGIGVLSYFMLADAISVDTRRLLGPAQPDGPLYMRVESVDSVFWLAAGIRPLPGTTTEFFIRPESIWYRRKDSHLLTAIKTSVPHPPIPIRIRVGSSYIIHDGHDYCEPIDETWGRANHIRRLDVNLTDEQKGIVGVAAIAILESNGVPVNSFRFDENESDFAASSGRKYWSELMVTPDSHHQGIFRRTNSFEQRRDTGLRELTHLDGYVHSRGQLALHGISVYREMFSPVNSFIPMLPFAISCKLDVVSPSDLDLQAAQSRNSQ